MEIRLLRWLAFGGFEMLAPLPALHRFVLVLTALAVCIGIGVWLGFTPGIPLNLRLGLTAGTAAGLAAAFALVHDFHQRGGDAARTRRHSH